MKKLKWGVIGAGGIADRRTLPGLIKADNAALSAVMEIDRDFAARLADKYNADASYTCHKQLLQDKNVEAVYIASPVAAHFGQARDALGAGKHVLIEKPLAMTSAQGDELIKIAASKKLCFAAGFMMRFHGHHQKARELARSGALGHIVSVRAQLTCWYPEIQGAWRQSLELSGGGALMDMGVHCIDILQYIMDAKTVSVAAMIDRQFFNYEVEDGAGVLLRFSNGAMGYVDSHFNIPDAAAEGRLEIYGTLGSLLCSGTIGQEEGGRAVLTCAEDVGYQAAQTRADETGARELPLFPGNLYQKQIESFGRSVLDGAPVEVPAADAVQIQRVVEAAYASGKSGKLTVL